MGLIIAKPSTHLPTVLTRSEAQKVLQRMEGTATLAARLLYGAGQRGLHMPGGSVPDAALTRTRLGFFGRVSSGRKPRLR